MKSLQEYFEQERMREPIVDAVGVERFVEGVISGQHSGSRSRRITPLAGVASLILLMVIIGVVVGELGMEESVDADVQAKIEQAQHEGSIAFIDTPDVDKPAPTNEVKRSGAGKDTATTKREEIEPRRTRSARVAPIAPTTFEPKREGPKANNLNPKMDEVLNSSDNVVMSRDSITNRRSVIPLTPDQAARLMRDSIAKAKVKANVFRTLHVDGITPLALNAQELMEIDIRIERDSARLFKGAMSDGSAMTFVFSLATGHMDVSMIYDDKALYLDSFAQQPRDGIMPRMVTDMTGNRTLSNMSAPSFAPRAHRNIADSMSSYVAPEIDSAGRLMNKEAIAMQGKRQDRIAERIGLFDPNHLLPIRLAHPYSPDSIGVIFWYDPVPALLNKLPRWSLQEMREQMRRTDRTQLSGSDKEWTEYAEYVVDSLLAMRSSSIESVDESQAVRGDNLFNVGTADGAIASSSITPNPIAGAGRVTITLKRPRALDLRLLDLQGKMIRRLSDEGHYDAGTVEIAVDLTDVTPGIYLLSITTDKGEQVVHRVVAE